MRILGERQPIALGPASAQWVPVRIEAAREKTRPGSNRIEFTIEALPEGGGEPIRIVEKATFIVQ